ncbi:ATP-binding protein [Sphaerisporangium corydalis]|uniref:ATP-binding protein n=1 Tax=Sphaerisporangium corydalis TaxID=1441875 RepID=A0ABV9ESY8_9ACTN|nr:ATP-binding protein [Sphaerisporangium corydalis]
MTGHAQNPGMVSQDAKAFGRSYVNQVGGDQHIHHHYPPMGSAVAAGTETMRGTTPGRVRPGRPLTQVTDPFALEVHHAIESATASLPQLPAYVPREHDHELARAVQAALDGHSAIAVLVGRSSTGKTRACWEALQPLRKTGGWWLWHPIDPTRPDAALADLGRIEPYTVVWLNEAQFYLADPALGERVAAGLRELLRDASRRPVLVLATVWPDHWGTLTTISHPDVHSQARALLTGHNIWVPETFAGTDLDALAIHSAYDPRLRQAAKYAGNGQITQYLAGVPVLVDRYRGAPPATRALIHAAMDARRLGCGPRLPLALLVGAAPGYLTNREWEQTSEDWFEQALNYTATPCNGIPGILTPAKAAALRNRRRGAPGLQPATKRGPVYRLADYIDQYGHTHRAEQIPPIDFWTAAAAHAHPSDLRALGDAAWNRGLYRGLRSAP